LLFFGCAVLSSKSKQFMGEAMLQKQHRFSLLWLHYSAGVNVVD